MTLQGGPRRAGMAGIDTAGLDAQDRRYLETLIRVFGGGPAGVEAIAHTMNTSTDTLEDEVEPFLLRSELVVRTPRGRVATPRPTSILQIPRRPTAALILTSDSASEPCGHSSLQNRQSEPADTRLLRQVSAAHDFAVRLTVLGGDS